jgi:alginate O-acetyltransferase complex protein AlgI
MLFNSYPFLLGFFPVTVVVFLLLSRRSHDLAAAWLALASLFFYAYWSVTALPLLVGSIGVNYWFGLRITPSADAPRSGKEATGHRRWLIAAVVVDLAVLAYFKYADFFIDNLNLGLRAMSAAEVRALHVVLPIGISFFSFTQIAYLVDCYEGKVRERNFVHYALFVSYFPHLVAGPVLHHGQMMPQFGRPETYRLDTDNVLAGLFNIAVGLCKKVLLADEFSQYASPIFDAVRAGQHLGFVAAWVGALAYTLQIYFDFSGYSDMAIGLSRILNISLPLNFNAPYKAASIIDFWRRWHMSLSHFLRDYLYKRLGGNRRGPVRRYANLVITMLLGGFWHGASWTFVVWGGLHGLYLLVNHAWRGAAGALPRPAPLVAALGRSAGALLTFLAVVVAWVFFRSTTFEGAGRMLVSMFEPGPRPFDLTFESVFRGIALPPTSWAYLGSFLAAGYAICWFLPTSQSLTERVSGAREHTAWVYAGMLLFGVLLIAVVNASHRVSEFIYFNF